ncbi:MAG: hypothetical protein RIR00_2472 [Pseudomonadota bacterium]|jgi:hypothetical protein
MEQLESGAETGATAVAAASRGRRLWRWLRIVLLAGAGLIVLFGVFAAYQQPDLLLDWLSLRYCG